MIDDHVIISPRYREATQVALAQQIPIALICLMILDGGAVAKICGIAMTGFWIGAAVVAFRRSWTPTRVDLWFWRWGFLPCLVIAGMLARLWLVF